MWREDLERVKSVCDITRHDSKMSDTSSYALIGKWFSIGFLSWLVHCTIYSTFSRAYHWLQDNFDWFAAFNADLIGSQVLAILNLRDFPPLPLAAIIYFETRLVYCTIWLTEVLAINEFQRTQTSGTQRWKMDAIGVPHVLFSAEFGQSDKQHRKSNLWFMSNPLWQ